MSRGRIVIVTLCVLTAVFAYFFWRDLRLPQNFVPRDLPDLVVENFSFKRTIADREWNVEAVSAEHRSGVVTAVSIDIMIIETSGDMSAVLFAESGDFTRENSEMLLYSIDGSISTKASSVDLNAAVGSYDATLGAWRFSKGIELSGEDKFVKGSVASVDRSGNFDLWKGVSATWVME